MPLPAESFSNCVKPFAPVTILIFPEPFPESIISPLAKFVEIFAPLNVMLPVLPPPPPPPAANTPLPYSTLLALPSKLTVAMFPIPTTLATATWFATFANETVPETLAP